MYMKHLKQSTLEKLQNHNKKKSGQKHQVKKHTETKQNKGK